jgi:hypothetical protein
MLPKTEFVPKTTEILNQDYDRYLLEGGKLPYEDFLYVLRILTEEAPFQPNMDRCPCRSQIAGICESCGLELSQQETEIYRGLRQKMAPNTQFLNCKNSKNPWQMHDVELAREIFLLTDPTREKYQKIAETFPHMFEA